MADAPCVIVVDITMRERDDLFDAETCLAEAGQRLSEALGERVPLDDNDAVALAWILRFEEIVFSDGWLLQTDAGEPPSSPEAAFIVSKLSLPRRPWHEWRGRLHGRHPDATLEQFEQRKEELRQVLRGAPNVRSVGA